MDSNSSIGEEVGQLGQAAKKGASAAKGAAKAAKAGAKATAKLTKATIKLTKAIIKLIIKIVVAVVSALGAGFIIFLIIIIAAISIVVAVVGGGAKAESGLTSVADNELSPLATYAQAFKGKNLTAALKTAKTNLFQLGCKRDDTIPSDWTDIFIALAYKQSGISLENVYWDIDTQKWYDNIKAKGEIVDNIYQPPNRGDITFYKTSGDSHMYCGIVDKMTNTGNNEFSLRILKVIPNHKNTDMIVGETNIYSDGTEIIGYYLSPRSGDKKFNIRKKAPNATVKEYSTENYYKDDSEEALFSHGQFVGGTKAYVWGRAYEVYGEFFNTHISRKLPVKRKPKAWYPNYNGTKTSRAAAGNIACWCPNNAQSGDGMLAFVESVSKTGDIIVSYSEKGSDETKFVYKTIKKYNGSFDSFGCTFQGFLSLGEGGG